MVLAPSDQPMLIHTNATTVIGPFSIALRQRGSRFEIRVTTTLPHGSGRVQFADPLPALKRYLAIITATAIHGDPWFEIKSMGD